MKYFTQSTLINQAKAIFILLGSLVILSSCSQKISFATSTVVPAAEGKVTVKRDDNKNYALNIDVRNLAEPGRLTPSRNAYVVWLQTEDNVMRNVGQLKSSSGMFSSGLKASLNTISAAKPRRVFITAEDSPEVTNHSGQIVLTTPDF